jgi:hypothetical protein
MPGSGGITPTLSRMALANLRAAYWLFVIE